MVTSSHLLLARSKESSIEAKWAFVSAKVVCSMGRPILVGMTTTIPKAIENDDSPVGLY